MVRPPNGLAVPCTEPIRAGNGFVFVAVKAVAGLTGLNPRLRLEPIARGRPRDKVVEPHTHPGWAEAFSDELQPCRGNLLPEVGVGRQLQHCLRESYGVIADQGMPTVHYPHPLAADTGGHHRDAERHRAVARRTLRRSGRTVRHPPGTR